MTSLRVRADRYVDAARHMQPSQLLHRPRRLVPPRLLAAGRARGAAWTALAAGAGVEVAPQSGPQPAPDEVGTFSAIGRMRTFGADGFWTDDRDGLLFLFHLHGFADLARYSAGAPTERGEAFWERVVGDWLDACGTPARPAWHPYPTSGRIIAWCAWLSVRAAAGASSEAVAGSLERQLRLLRRSVEHDIGGNHVLRNGAALAIGGACLGLGRERAAGLQLLERELARQLLADGGHEERSPSYHRIVLTDLDDVATVLARAGSVPDWLEDARRQMRDWLDALTGPDGLVPLLNDAWEGPGGTRATRDMTDLAESGYVVLRHGGDQAVLDVGPVAPAHLPPHAHADVLSFVLWADGAPVIVDPGTGDYSGPQRARFRGTAAHGTVKIDGHDQCDLWGAFRAAHMPHVRRLRTERHGDAVVVAAEHDGYARLPGPVTHRRTFCWLPGDGLVVVDRLIGLAGHRATSRLPLAPGIAASPGHVGPFTVSALGPGSPARLSAGTYSPFLGTFVSAPVIVRGAAGELTGWALLRDGAEAALSGAVLSVRRRGGGRLALDVG